MDAMCSGVRASRYKSGLPGICVGVGVGGTGVGVDVAVGAGVGVGAGVAVGAGVGEGVGVAVGVGVGDGTGVAVGMGVEVGMGVAVGAGVGVGVGAGAGVEAGGGVCVGVLILTGSGVSAGGIVPPVCWTAGVGWAGAGNVCSGVAGWGVAVTTTVTTVDASLSQADRAIARMVSVVSVEMTLITTLLLVFAVNRITRNSVRHDDQL